MVESNKRVQFDTIVRLRKLSYTELASRVGVSEKTIRNFRDGGSINIEKLIDIAKVLDVSIDFMLGVESDENTSLELQQKEIMRLYEKSERFNEISSSLFDVVKTQEELLRKIEGALLGDTSESDSRKKILAELYDKYMQIRRL